MGTMAGTLPLLQGPWIPPEGAVGEPVRLVRKVSRNVSIMSLAL